MSEQSFVAAHEDIGKRLDVFVSENYLELSRSFLKKHIESGQVSVNDKAEKASYKLKEGDEVKLLAPEEIIPDILPENIPLEIIYEDDSIIVINKPKGMVTHPAPGHYRGTLVNALMYHCKDSLSLINGVLRPGIVHRLDMDTSGLMVVAKSDMAHKRLSEQISERKVKKIYEAITLNIIKDDTLHINKPIGRSERNRKKMRVTEKNSKEAITNVKVIERFRANTFVEAELITGRTHQIRVHLAHLGYPILGDSVYGAEKCRYRLQGQALFARTLGFLHPASGEYIEFEAVRPEYMDRLLKGFR